MSAWTEFEVIASGVTLADWSSYPYPAFGAVHDLLGLKSDYAFVVNLTTIVNSRVFILPQGSIDGTNWNALGSILFNSPVSVGTSQLIVSQFNCNPYRYVQFFGCLYQGEPSGSVTVNSGLVSAR